MHHQEARCASRELWHLFAQCCGACTQATSSVLLITVMWYVCLQMRCRVSELIALEVEVSS